jgi:predicted O-methyltransferase YrrM
MFRRRSVSLQRRVVWATVPPYHRPHVFVGRFRLDPGACVVANGDHPVFARVRRDLAAALVPPQGLLAELETYRGEASELTVEHDPHGQLHDRTVPAGEDRERIVFRPPFTRFLYFLARDLRPEHVLECGTGYGGSSLHILAALEDADHGHLHTVELDPTRRRLAQEAIDRFFPGTQRLTSLGGSFADVLPEVVESIGPLDLVFEDGPHTPEVTLNVFHQLVDAVRPGGVLIFDDVQHEKGNNRAWSEIKGDPRVAASLEINGRLGLCVHA